MEEKDEEINDEIFSLNNLSIYLQELKVCYFLIKVVLYKSTYIFLSDWLPGGFKRDLHSIVSVHWTAPGVKPSNYRELPA